MDLLEREPILAELESLLRDAAAGAGHIAAVCGEAGAGKTSLAERFTATHGGRALRGLCDPLSTPRPLGPIHDMTRQSDGPLSAALRAGEGREGVFSAFLEELDVAPSPRMVLVEDVHWADDATLDLLKFVGRRIRRFPALLLITYRDDEVGSQHRLHQLLGELPAGVVRWLRLPLLSDAAVRELARRSGHAGEGLFTLTGGNPFFVTEVLASSGGAVPASIREAVLARAARLSAPARGLLDVVSLAPGRMERRLLETLVDGAPALVRECASTGVLAVAAEAVGFRHELARLAWQASLEPGTDRLLHARILQALLDREAGSRELARIVHHADGAGDGQRVLHFASAAAREAMAVGAHRQAAAQYATAMRYADGLAPPELATLLEAYSFELYMTGGIAESIQVRERALALRRQLDDRVREGGNLRWLSRLAWFSGRRAEAGTLGELAIQVLEPLGPTPELAMAYSNLAQLAMLADQANGTIAWGERAIAMAEQVGDTETLVHALTNVGSAEMYTPQSGQGRKRIERAIELALRHGFHEHAVRGYTNIACNDVRHRDYERAVQSVAMVLRFSIDHEIETWEFYILGWRARLELEHGNWAAAERDAQTILGRYQALTVTRCQPLIVLALLRARRGANGVAELLDEAMALATRTEETQRLAPATAALAEAAWIRGDLAAVVGDIRKAYATALASDDLWAQGLLASWLRRAGGLDAVPDAMPEPFQHLFAGDWRGAAAQWQAIGAPYERALALADGNDPAAHREALEQLERLGANASAAAVRRDLRARGFAGIPRGQRSTTRQHPAGLTRSQTRVLALLARGLSNSAIARELFLSPRTVDHHVSAILGKLGVATRTEAIAAVHDRGILPESREAGES